MNLTRHLCSAACATLLLAVAQTSQAAPIRVAVEDGVGGGGAATVAQLNDDTFFDFQATLVNAGQIDSALELANFDVVILGGTGFNNADWTVAMANALTAFVQGGGGVVSTGWFNFDVRNEPQDLILDALIPLNNSQSVNEFVSGGDVIDILDNLHPITLGLADFAPGGDFIEVNRFAPEAGDTVLAAIQNLPNDLSIAYKQGVQATGLGCSVYLGPLYLADVNLYNTAPLRSGNPDQLLEQAVNWASTCGQSVDEPAALPLTGLGLVVAGLLGGMRRRRG